MKRIAFVNQRYGKEVNGGSEYYTRLMAQKLKEHYEVEVLTSKALTYENWEDYYKEDVEEIDGVKVRRFGVKTKRSRVLQRFLKILIMRFGGNTRKITETWNKVLGPYVPSLVKYIRENKDEYDVFIFVTYMYYPAVFGMREVAEKAIFVPTAHDEYCIYFKLYDELFRLPRKIIFLTPEERAFVHGLFHNEKIDSEVIGVGIDLPESADEESFREKYEIEGEYLLYAGRVEVEKGCDEMFAYFQNFSEKRKDLQLVVIGKAYMDIPEQDNIRYLGFVSEEDKYNAIKGAKLLWLPSQFESLSIAVLEAMALGVPVIVNGKCEVLKGHCERSNAGEAYSDFEGFETIIESIMGKKYIFYGKKAQEYIARYYTWNSVIDKWKAKIEEV
ncbi:glycosyltransferase involved in cell wall biosynthesis [Kineothrix alysoides]|uniref:Glycosyltransferase involved in cell wall biosynthesis n=1 Tax=Kineothrix alysoides TaxID=1469948 RepID=A0A4V2QC90_9FIRM|nr:glycosyltransferase family 4 protein [Kineothrix alysoides]TCL59377.1 glycosyltransferase involved in cell wall biosynthesis [Kineothrix alysoides]